MKRLVKKNKNKKKILNKFENGLHLIKIYVGRRQRKMAVKIKLIKLVSGDVHF